MTLLSRGFWLMMAFCGTCILAGALVALFGPRLWAPRPSAGVTAPLAPLIGRPAPPALGAPRKGR